MDQERGNEFKQSQTQPLVTLGGTAAEGSSGPPLGLVDLGTSEGAYLLRVALPGIRHNKSKVTVNIQGDGIVHIEGWVPDNDFLKAYGKKFQMKVQELAPPGNFEVSFQLPGRVDPRLAAPNFTSSGILEIVCRKETPYMGSVQIPAAKE